MMKSVPVRGVGEIERLRKQAEAAWGVKQPTTSSPELNDAIRKLKTASRGAYGRLGTDVAATSGVVSAFKKAESLVKTLPRNEQKAAMKQVLRASAYAGPSRGGAGGTVAGWSPIGDIAAYQKAEAAKAAEAGKPTQVSPGEMLAGVMTPPKKVADQKAHDRAIKILEEQGFKTKEGYDIAAFLRVYSGGEKTLRDAGFSNPDISKAEKFNKEMKETQDKALKEAKGFKAKHIKLPDDKYVAIKDWNKLAPKYQTIGIRQGLDAMEKVIDKDTKALKPYKIRPIKITEVPSRKVAPGVSGQGTPEKPMAGQLSIGEPTYDLLRIVKEGKLEEVKDTLDLSAREVRQLKELKPYISVPSKEEVGATSSIDVLRAAGEGKVKPQTLKQQLKMSDQDIRAVRWAHDFEKANFAEKMGMAAKKDPMEFAKTMGVGLIPVYGTMKFWDKASPAMNAVGVITDIALFIPFVNGVSAGVKSGLSIGRATLKATMATSRGVVVAPYSIVRHPVATAKSMIAPIEVLISKNRMPLATLWRGSYSPNMDIAKVVAGDPKEALATRKAMEAFLKQVTSGEKAAGAVKIADIGELKFSGTGLQKVMPGTTITASPYGDAFKGKGVLAEGEGIWTAPDGYLGLTGASASGQKQLYVFKGDKLLGMVGKTGEVLDDHGKVIGRIAENTKVIGLDGKSFGALKGNQVLRDGKVVAELKNGAIVSSDLETIGKFYKGTPEIKEHKVVGTIDKAGNVVDESGKVVAKAGEKIVAFLPDNAKVVGPAGKVIGKTKPQPVFAVIQTQGVQELPKSVQSAKNLKDMEARAWKLFKSGKEGNKLYPVFKQYAKWIEEEALLPKGSRLIPVVNSQGKPVVMWTRGLGGEKIEVPILQVVKNDWLAESQRITRALKGGRLEALKPKMTVAEMLKDVQDIPKAKKSAAAIMAWFKKNPKARMVGSTVEYLFTGKHKPNDLDMGAPNPAKAAKELAAEIKKASGMKVRVSVREDGSAMLDWYDKKADTWREMANIKHLGEYPTTTVNGVTMETPGSQLSRTLTRMEAEFGGKGYARFQRYVESLGGEVDIGIGGKAPSLRQALRLKAYGVKNTIRDIFKAGLSKSTRQNLAKTMDPELADDVKALARFEERLAEANQRYRQAARTGAGTSARQLRGLRADQTKLAEQYRLTMKELRAKLEARARKLERILDKVPARYSRAAEAEYQRLVKRMPRERIVLPVTGKEAIKEPSKAPPQKRGLVSRKKREPTPEKARVPERPTPTRKTVPVAETLRVPTERIPTERTLGERIPSERLTGEELTTTRLTKEKTEIRIPSKKQDREARERIKAAGGAIAWRQGEVGGKDRWDVILHPYQKNQDFVMVLGAPPEGASIAEKGKGSAYGSAQVIRGKGPTRDVKVDSGFVDVTVSPSSGKGKKVRLKFTPDPEGKTTGDITIGGQLTQSRGVRLTEKTPLPHSRAPAISSRRGLRLSPRFRGFPR